MKDFLKRLFSKKQDVTETYSENTGMYVISYRENNNNLYDLYDSNDQILLKGVGYETLDNILKQFK